MKNEIKRSYAGVIQQVTDAIAGMQQHGATLNLVLVDVDEMIADLAVFTTNGSSASVARSTLSARQKTHDLAIGEARTFGSTARDLLRLKLGKKYSAAWIQAGFLNNLRVPYSSARVQTLLETMAAYFAANPTHENAALDITAARATLLKNNLVAARTAHHSQRASVQAALTTRNADAAKLQRYVRTLLKELSVRLEPMDDRWLAFGFNRPGQLVTPEVPQKFTAALLGANNAVLRWEKGVRATTYRVWKRVVGVDNEWVEAGTSKSLQFTLQDLPANSKVEFAVSSVNNGGESAKTEVASVQTV